MENAKDLLLCQVTLFGEMAFYRPHPVEKALLPVAVRFKTTKARLLFAYMLIHSGQAHNREVLAAMFWPESGETDRKNLRDALAAIRAALREADFPEETFLLANNFTVRAAATDVIRTDVAAFDAALRRIEAARPALSVEERISTLEEAVALYRGPLLCSEVDGKDAEEWIAPLRYRYSLLFDNALSQLYTLHASRGDVPRALFHARRYAENSPSDTERAETVRALSERLQQMEHSDAMQRLEERTPSLDVVASAPPEGTVASVEPTPAEATALPQATLTPPPASPAPSLPTNERKTYKHTRVRWLAPASALAATALLGALGGVFLSRTSGKPALPARPRVSNEPGNLTEKNPYIAPDAQEMEQEDYEGALGHYLVELEATPRGLDRLRIGRRLLDLGHSAHYRAKGKGQVAKTACEEALRVFRAEKDLQAIGDTLLLFAQVLLLRGDSKQSEACVEEALRLAANCNTELAKASLLNQIADWKIDMGEYDTGSATLEQAMAIYTKGATPEHQRGRAFVMWTRGRFASDKGDYELAKKLLTEAAARMEKLKNQEQTRAAVLGDLGDVYVREGDAAKATGFYEEGLRVWEGVSHKNWMALFKARLANATLLRAEQIALSTQTRLWQTDSGRNLAKAAETLCGESLALLKDSNAPVIRARPLLVLGQIRHHQEKFTEAQKMLEESLELRKNTGGKYGLVEALEILAIFEARSNQATSAQNHTQQAAALRKKAGIQKIPPYIRPEIVALRSTLHLPPLEEL